MTLQSCILFWSLINGVDPSLTKAMISVESKGNPFARGSQGEVGLLQIKPKYVKETALQLSQSCTNVMVGTRILKELKYKCKHTLDKTFIVCFNLGPRAARRIKKPKQFPYYRKVIAQMEEK